MSDDVKRRKKKRGPTRLHQLQRVEKALRANAARIQVLENELDLARKFRSGMLVRLRAWSSELGLQDVLCGVCGARHCTTHPEM